MPLYREQEDFPPKDLASCQTWWDVVVYRFNGELASISFVVERQEETLKFEPAIQRAWLRIALSDYRTELARVYDCLNNFDGSRESRSIKELYNQESYIFADAKSLANIKANYLDKYDLVTPDSQLLRRYVKYLFQGSAEEQWPDNQAFLTRL